MSNKIEIMINKCYGGFSFSAAAKCAYKERTGSTDARRHDPLMIQIVKEMGSKANGPHAAIEVHEIPAKFENHYEIDDYDGMESVIILYDRYKNDAIAAMLKDAGLTTAERVERALALLEMGEDEL